IPHLYFLLILRSPKSTLFPYTTLFRSRLKAKLAGGAQMFQHHHSTDIMRIGPRNIEAVQERLKTHQIPITAKDVGGTSGRTIEFDPLTNQLKIRTVNKGEVFI